MWTEFAVNNKLQYRTVSELSRLIVQIVDTLRFEPPLGGA